MFKAEVPTMQEPNIFFTSSTIQVRCTVLDRSWEEMSGHKQRPTRVSETANEDNILLYLVEIENQCDPANTLESKPNFSRVRPSLLSFLFS